MTKPLTTTAAQPGAIVRCSGFTCIQEGDTRTIFADDKGWPYICCAEGKHYLDGQAYDGDQFTGGCFVGLTLVQEAKP